MDVKDPKYGGRVVANMVSVAKPTLPVSQDVQRHIMGFLSERDLVHSALVSKDWKKTSLDDWNVWLRIANREAEEGLPPPKAVTVAEFKGLGRTPVQAYRQLSGAQRLNRAITEYLRAIDLITTSPDNPDLEIEVYTKETDLWSAINGFNFITELTPGLFNRMYTSIQRLGFPENELHVSALENLRYHLANRRVC